MNLGDGNWFDSVVRHDNVDILVVRWHISILDVRITELISRDGHDNIDAATRLVNGEEAGGGWLGPMPRESWVAANTVAGSVTAIAIANTGANTMAGDDRGYINMQHGCLVEN